MYNKNGKIEVLSFDINDPQLDASDPRVIKYKGQNYLTTLSYLRLVCSDDDVHFYEDPAFPPIYGEGFLESFGIEDCRVATMVNVKGTVRDAVTKEELIGVSVLVTEGKSGTVTDVNGAFSIMAPSNGTLRISYVGYKPQQVKINGQTTLNIQLAQESSTLDELVVVGYAVQKKRDILGAVSKVSDKELNAVPVATAQQALQGRVAGVQVSVQTGAPGSDVSVHIRGVNSISLGNEPLYIVDGIAVEGALNNISTSDIDNITVLKDASSAAIYGSRATNGIVVITTKLGKSGEAKISYSMGMTFDETVANSQFKTEGKGWTAVLKQGESNIYGTSTNLPSFITGKVGKAIYFNNGSHLEISDYTSSDLLGNTLSIAAWVMP